MKSVSHKNVTITGSFWHRMQEKNRTVIADAVYDRFSETGRFRALDCDWVEGMDYTPHKFWDSDVFKWMEGIAYILAHHKDTALEEKMESCIDKLEKAQWEDGYLQTYFTAACPQERFTNRDSHELYCMGHLMEAAVAYFEATGKRRLLDIACRCADCIYKIFAEEQSAAFLTPGHEEIELALLRLYRVTGNQKHLDLCRFFLDTRGNNTEDKGLTVWSKKIYHQDNAPVRKLRSAEGHCVRACYLYTAMADFAAETGDDEMMEACKALWDDIVNTKMYLTGGIGSTHWGEAFTLPYHLPNDTAYTETCAAISLAYFSQKMLQATNEAKYADIVERTLYNGILSGVSMDGKAFFYTNPQRIDANNRLGLRATNKKVEDFPIHKRQAVFKCSCCPPNLVRLLASLGDYFYGKQDDRYYVNQFGSSEYWDGSVVIRQETTYPTGGSVAIHTENVKVLCIRIPGWCKNFTLSAPYTVENGYAVVTDVPENLIFTMEMAPMLLRADPRVSDCAGKAAVQLGPVVYCAEEADNPGLHSLILDKNTDFTQEYSKDWHCTVLKAKAFRLSGTPALYSVWEESCAPAELTLIPYYAFANREQTDMTVWLPIK